jgi:hypothetical protein
MLYVILNFIGIVGAFGRHLFYKQMMTVKSPLERNKCSLSSPFSISRTLDLMKSRRNLTQANCLTKKMCMKFSVSGFKW